MSLPAPTLNLDAYIDAVVSERQAGANAAYFGGVRAAWKARVKVFIDAEGNPEAVKPWPAVIPHRQKYLTLYGNPKPGSAQGQVLAQLRNRVLQVCPACGEDGTPNTLDHYLPKESYPELSIAPHNLSPMCDICQLEKSDQTLDGNNRRIFLHPYFDKFLNAQAVMLRIMPPYNAPTAQIEPHPALEVAERALVQRHLDGLSIPNRYNHFFKDQYLRLLRLTQRMRDANQNVRESLQKFKAMAALKSVNSWPHLFYEAVVSTEDLLQFLEKGELPAAL